jgi:hypothetical protein
MWQHAGQGLGQGTRTGDSPVVGLGGPRVEKLAGLRVGWEKAGRAGLTRT